jgi:hypothetical protein
VRQHRSARHHRHAGDRGRDGVRLARARRAAAARAGGTRPGLWRGQVAPQHRPGRGRDQGDAGTRRSHDRRRPGVGALRRARRRLRRVQGPPRRGAPGRQRRSGGLHRPDHPGSRNLDAARTGGRCGRQPVRRRRQRRVGGRRQLRPQRFGAQDRLGRAVARLLLADHLGDRQRGRPRPGLAGPGPGRSVGVRGGEVGDGLRAAPRSPRWYRWAGQFGPRMRLVRRHRGGSQHRLRAVRRRCARRPHRPHRAAAPALACQRGDPRVTGRRRRPGVGIGPAGRRAAPPSTRAPARRSGRPTSAPPAGSPRRRCGSAMCWCRRWPG